MSAGVKRKKEMSGTIIALLSLERGYVQKRKHLQQLLFDWHHCLVKLAHRLVSRHNAIRTDGHVDRKPKDNV